MRATSSLAPSTRVAFFVGGLAIACLVLADQTTHARPDHARALTAESFEQAAPRGFGDRNNSWAQAMLWWQDALYVGTSRQSVCTSLFSLWSFASIAVSIPFADMWFPYPPDDPDLSCAEDGADLSLQAEIWRWSPDTETWDRVFQSPLELDNPGPGPPFPPRVGKKLPYEISIRGLASHIEPDGTDALYAFGVNSTVMWDRSQLPPPRILRSVDGLNFVPLPQTPGTFLGDLPFNPDHSSFRSPASYRGKLFVLCGPIFGQGTLIGSEDPALGDDAWFVASPPGLLFFETVVFNDWLYLGGFDPAGGYTVIKTRAEGPPPYQFITVVPAGAFLQPRPSRSVVSMHVHDGRLYVGTATQTEVIRINPDDTWDLVVGSPRLASLPGGGTEWKYPLSGLDAGFGHTLNDHAWNMEGFKGHLYIGTYNATTGSRNGPFGPLLEHNMGAHLYRTLDGWHYSAVTTTGFASPADPFGGVFDYGVRTLTKTPYGLFLGTANDYYGLAIFRATKERARVLNAPERLEIEQTVGGHALLSWDPSSSNGDAAFRSDTSDAPYDSFKKRPPYQVWRALVKFILLRDEVSYIGWNGQTGNKIPDWYVGPYELIAVTHKKYYIDSTVEAGKKYMYYVVEEPDGETVNDASNLVAFPLLLPAMTFAQLEEDVDRLHQRERFRDEAAWAAVRDAVAAASALAADCHLDESADLLEQISPVMTVLQPDAVDFEVLLAKLVRRLELFERLPLEMQSGEFCSRLNITLESETALLRQFPGGGVVHQTVTGVPIEVTQSGDTSTVLTTGGILVPNGGTAVLLAPASIVENQTRFEFLFWRDSATGQELADNPLTYVAAGPSKVVAYYGLEGTVAITVEARSDDRLIEVPIVFSHGGRVLVSGRQITSFDVLPPRNASLTLIASPSATVVTHKYGTRTYVHTGWTHPGGFIRSRHITIPATARGTVIAHYDALPKKVTLSLRAETIDGSPVSPATVVLLQPSLGLVALPTTLTLAPGEAFSIHAPFLTGACTFVSWFKPATSTSLFSQNLNGSIIEDTTRVLRVRCPS